MANLNTETMLEIVQKNARKLETFTNIPFYSSPIPEELELREHEVTALTGHFISYMIFSDISAVRFNFKTGLNQRSRHLLHSCDVWVRESSLEKPTYTVLLNPNAKSEIAGGIRTVADLLLGKKTMLQKESEIQYLPQIIREKTQNDIEEFIDDFGVENIKDKNLSQIYNQYSTWADSDDRRIIPKHQFFRVFKDFLVKKRITSDTISTGHVYTGIAYSFRANPDEEKLFSKEILSNKTFLKARLVENLLYRMAHGDPEINGIFICGQIVDELTMVKSQIRKANAQKKTVFFREIYGFASFITALWQNRMGKILVFNKADSLFATYNQTVRNIVHLLLEKDGPRIIQYIRTVVTRKNESLNFLLTEAKTVQPKPNPVMNGEFTVDDIMDAEDKMYDTEDEGIPDNFEFQSKVIFLTDLPTVPEDFRDIPTCIELNYSKEQALSLIEANLEDIMVGFSEVTMPRKREILQFMRLNKGMAKSFNYSTFWHIAMVYMSGLKNWQRWATAQLTGAYMPL